MEELRVGSWTELVDRLYESSWNVPHGRFRSSYVFRGLPDWRYHRKTSLCRLGGSFHKVEDALLRNFRKYAHQSQSPGASWWNWLALAQHHGLPTRLLDWTFSPFVALHFATDKYDLFNVDAVVWCINVVELRRFLPSALNSLLEQESSMFFSAFTLDRYARTLSEFDHRVEEEGEPCVIFFEPPALDERIVNQSALFSMMSSPMIQLEDWLRAHEQENPRLCRKIVIPASLKWEIRDKLDMANTTERVMFPGLDGLTSWLKRYYAPNHMVEVDGKLARITQMENATICVEYENGVTEELTTTPGSQWQEQRTGRNVFVVPRPTQSWQT